MYPSAAKGVFGREDDQKSSSRYPSTSRQQSTPTTGNPSYSDLHWTSEPRGESYVPAGLASNTSPWPSSAFPGPAFSTNVVGAGVWPGNQRLDAWLCVPGSNAVGLGTNYFAETETAPISEQPFPVVQRVFPTSQPYPPPPRNWAQAPSPPRQSTPFYDRPVCPHGGDSGSIDSFGTRVNIPRFPEAVPSMIPEHSQCRITPTSRLPSVATPHSVWSLAKCDPVLAAPSTSIPRGERLDFSSSMTTFQCLWTSSETRCTALIAGERKNVTSHLRDKHKFTCDGQMIVCEWGQCTAPPMQRRNIPRHIVACHLEIKVPCPRCGLLLSRADANRKHQAACTGSAATLAVMEGGEDDERLLF